MEKGFVLVSTRHPYYGKMAYNLAVSIKAMDRFMPIALIYDQASIAELTESQRSVFDHKIQAPSSDWRECRFDVAELTPFEENVFLDVDMVWINHSPSAAFDLLDDVDFTCVNEGYYDLEEKKDYSSIYTWGVELQKLIDTYNLPSRLLWKIRGEFFVFRKTEVVVGMFKAAKEIFRNVSIPTSGFAGGRPTEWAFDVAINQAGMDCHLSNWQPAYWPIIQNRMIPDLHIMNKSFFALSAGGSIILPKQKILYDLVMETALQKFGLRHLFPLQQKHRLIPERTTRRNG